MWTLRRYCSLVLLVGSPQRHSWLTPEQQFDVKSDSVPCLFSYVCVYWQMINKPQKVRVTTSHWVLQHGNQFGYKFLTG